MQAELVTGGVKHRDVKVGRYCKRQAKECKLPGHILELSRLFASGFRVYLHEAKTNKIHKAKNVLSNHQRLKMAKDSPCSPIFFRD